MGDKMETKTFDSWFENNKREISIIANTIRESGVRIDVTELCKSCWETAEDKKKEEKKS